MPRVSGLPPTAAHVSVIGIVACVPSSSLLAVHLALSYAACVASLSLQAVHQPCHTLHVHLASPILNEHSARLLLYVQPAYRGVSDLHIKCHQHTGCTPT